jgi:two-component system, NarL family, response regulator LiaR
VSRIKVLIVDDHKVVRNGLRFMLAQEPDVAVVGDAGDGAAALAEIRRCRPDVVLLDLVMPILDGLSVLRAMPGEAHRPAVVVLTSSTDERLTADAMRAGAVSWLAKTTGAEHVTAAVRSAAAGGVPAEYAIRAVQAA